MSRKKALVTAAVLATLTGIYLLVREEGLAAERVFVTRGEESRAVNGAVRMTLSLQ